MDEGRFQELMKKRTADGLTDEEANELGRMMAEKEGEPYSNAAAVDEPEAEADEDRPYSEAEVDDLKAHSEVRDEPEDSQKAS